MSSATVPPLGGSQAWLARWGGWLVLLVGACVYTSSFDTAFVLDDVQLRDNPVVSDFRQPVDLFDTEARSITFLTFRINHALDRALGGHGLRPAGYHVGNVLIHLLTAATLYQLVRTTHGRAPHAPGTPDGIAAAVAGLWVVHPLTTQAVTYTIQRAESLTALFIVITLFALSRGVDRAGVRRGLWFGLAVVACGVGMLTKQVGVVAPALALLFDRAYLAPSWAALLRQRGWLHLLLTAPAVLIVLSVLFPAAPAIDSVAPMSAGFALAKHSALEYAIAQPRSVLLYLRLAIVPYPLTFDYGWSVFASWSQAWVYWAFLAPLGIASLVALFRWPRVGFLAAAWFILLAPSSSVLPIADLAYEYRPYLALAPLLTLLVLTGARLLRDARPRLRLAIVACVIVTLGGLTILRNRDYASAERLWLDTTLKAPHNPRAHHNLANVYLEGGRFAEAIPAFERALALEPRNALARTNYAVALRAFGDPASALAQLRRALDDYPDFPATLYQLGVTARQLGQTADAESWLRRATEADPGHAAAWLDLGTLLYEKGDREPGVAAWTRAADLGLRSPDLYNNLGLAAAQSGDLPAATRWWETSLQLNPHQPDTRANLERARQMLKRP